MKKIILITIIAYLLGFLFFTYKINSYKQDNITKTDAIIVLTGGQNRIKTGAELKKANMAKKLFISGVSKQTSKKDLKILNNIDAELGHFATTTTENATETKEWITKNNIASIRLVTSNYHMPRAMQEIQNKNSKIKIIENPVYSDNINKKWWTSTKTSLFIFVEYNKFLYVFIRNLT